MATNNETTPIVVKGKKAVDEDCKKKRKKGHTSTTTTTTTTKISEIGLVGMMAVLLLLSFVSNSNSNEKHNTQRLGSNSGGTTTIGTAPIKAVNLLRSTTDGRIVVHKKHPLTMNEYYSGIDNSATDNTLRVALQELISQKTQFLFKRIWDAFAAVDKFLPGYPCDPSDLTKIPDIYSGKCWSPQHNVLGGECGNFKKEGDCFNREHSWPKSWFGGFSAGDGAQTDLFELYPSDGYVNKLRGNLPFGYVKEGTETYTSTNGSKIGICKSDEAQGKCFEIVDYLKGDLARSYFYLSTAYYQKWDCCDVAGVDKSHMKTWMQNDMRNWHANDPVDVIEQQRNDEIYNNWQHNRNPFIDHPEWVDQITDF